jgi:hypothetical protein
MRPDTGYETHRHHLSLSVREWVALISRIVVISASAGAALAAVMFVVATVIRLLT